MLTMHDSGLAEAELVRDCTDIDSFNIPVRCSSKLEIVES